MCVLPRIERASKDLDPVTSLPDILRSRLLEANRELHGTQRWQCNTISAPLLLVPEDTLDA